MAANYSDLEEYWGETSTIPAALDNFFDEENTISWTGVIGRNRKESSNYDKYADVVPSDHSSAIEDSILENITQPCISVEQNNVSLVGSAAGTKVVGRSLGALGERLQEFRSPVTWKTNDGVERCNNCAKLERKIANLSTQLETSLAGSRRSTATLPASVAVRAMLRGESFSLHGYQSLEDKQLLLQEALALHDTNTIITVILFCKNSLTKKLFIKEIEKSSVAVRTYISYLKQRRLISEAVEVLQLLGRKEEALLLLYRQAVGTNDAKRKEQSLRQLLDHPLLADNNADGTSLYFLTYYKKMFEQQLSLLQRQRALDDRDTKSPSNSVLKDYPRACNVYDKPLLTTLYYCSMYHWTEGQSGDGPPVYRQQFGLTERQYLWGVFRGRARVKHFYLPDQLLALLSTGRGGVIGALGGALSAVGATVSGSSSSQKLPVPIERLLDALKVAAAPDAVFCSYLALIEPKETRLQLALRYGVQSAIVDAYIALKDRSGLERLMLQLTPGCADHVKAETALKSGRCK